MAVKNLGLLILDVSDRTSPTLVGTYSVNKVWDVDVQGKYAYVASGTEGTFPELGAGLVILDISDPSNIVRVGTFAKLDSTRNVVVRGRYAYVNFRNFTYIIDVSNSKAPRQVSRIKYNAGKSWVQGNRLYIADKQLFIYDISNPRKPSLLGATPAKEFATTNALDVTVSGHHAVVAGGTRGVRIYDVSNPSAPVLESHLRFTLQYDSQVGHYLERAFSATVTGNTIYVGAATRTKGILYLLDLANL